MPARSCCAQGGLSAPLAGVDPDDPRLRMMEATSTPGPFPPEGAAAEKTQVGPPNCPASKTENRRTVRSKECPSPIDLTKLVACLGKA